jgi:2',3'-cyclic-nucleotide 2'-phosphodiesterase (5'-nucleotidase family)
MFASGVRAALGVDACMINGGGIRGDRDYEGVFTYGDLEAELPFANEVVVASMPGRVVRDAALG